MFSLRSSRLCGFSVSAIEEGSGVPRRVLKSDNVLHYKPHSRFTLGDVGNDKPKGRGRIVASRSAKRTLEQFG